MGEYIWGSLSLKKVGITNQLGKNKKSLIDKKHRNMQLIHKAFLALL